MVPTRIRPSLLAVASILLALPTLCLGQGPLTPPGPPGSTMKSLDQVEPRTPVDGLPFLINQPGSYFVVSNLTGVAGQNGIVIRADDVTLDLSGFTLYGNGGSLDHGILVDIQGSVPSRNVVIRNGSVAGWSGSGIRAPLGIATVCERIRASENGEDGIHVGTRSHVRFCHAHENRHGIRSGRDSIIQDCMAIGNELRGIFAEDYGQVLRCLATGNSVGVEVDSGSAIDCVTRENSFFGFLVNQALVRNCRAENHVLDGFRIEGSTRVQNCVAEGNGGGFAGTDRDVVLQDCSATSNSNYGFRVTSHSLLERCTASLNIGSGIEGGAHVRIRNSECRDNSGGAGITITGDVSRIENNQLSANTTGLQIVGSNCWVSGNIVAENGTNYDFTPGNHLNLILSEIPQTISWPATVTLAGSLQFTSGVNGVTIDAPYVTLDLAGHSLVGVGGGGGSVGVNITLAGSGASVKNGTIRDWASGVYTYNGSSLNQFRDLRIVNNTFLGLFTGDDARIVDCVVADNGLSGIFTGNRAWVRGCTAHGNGNFGIRVAAHSQVMDCTATQNTTSGINVNSRSTALNNVSSDNGENGIDSLFGCRVEGNTCNNNGIGTADGAGIRVVSDGGIYRNNFVGNNELGFRVTSPGNLIIGNFATDNSTNFFFNGFGTDSDYGEILTEPGPGFTNTNPYANFEEN